MRVCALDIYGDANSPRSCITTQFSTHPDMKSTAVYRTTGKWTAYLISMTARIAGGRPSQALLINSPAMIVML